MHYLILRQQQPNGFTINKKWKSIKSSEARKVGQGDVNKITPSCTSRLRSPFVLKNFNIIQIHKILYQTF